MIDQNTHLLLLKYSPPGIQRKAADHFKIKQQDVTRIKNGLIDDPGNVIDFLIEAANLNKKKINTVKNFIYNLQENDRPDERQLVEAFREYQREKISESKPEINNA